MNDHHDSTDEFDPGEPPALDDAIVARLAVDPLDELTRRRLKAAALAAFDEQATTTAHAAAPAIPTRTNGRIVRWLAPVAAAAALVAGVMAVSQNDGGSGGDQVASTANKVDGDAERVADDAKGGAELDPLSTTETLPGDGAGDQTVPMTAAVDLGDVTQRAALRKAVQAQLAPAESTSEAYSDSASGSGVCMAAIVNQPFILQATATYGGEPAVVYVTVDESLMSQPPGTEVPATAIVVNIESCDVVATTQLTTTL